MLVLYRCCSMLLLSLHAHNSCAALLLLLLSACMGVCMVYDTSTACRLSLGCRCCCLLFIFFKCACFLPFVFEPQCISDIFHYAFLVYFCFDSFFFCTYRVPAQSEHIIIRQITLNAAFAVCRTAGVAAAAACCLLLLHYAHCTALLLLLLYVRILHLYGLRLSLDSRCCCLLLL